MVWKAPGQPGRDAEIDHIVVLVDPKTALMAICARHRGFSIDARDRHACWGDQGAGGRWLGRWPFGSGSPTSCKAGRAEAVVL